MQIDEKFLDKSREDLLFEIGCAVEDVSLGSRNKTRMDFVFDAMAWMSLKKAEFAELVCRSTIISTIREHERSTNRLALISAIADLICQSCGKAPVVTVSLLLADEGLHALCGTDGCEIDKPKSSETSHESR